MELGPKAEAHAKSRTEIVAVNFIVQASSRISKI
jgi:hypothetical protein